MAGAIVRLRAAAAVGGRRNFASSSPCLMLPSNKMYCLRDKKVVNMNSSNNVEKEFESDSVIGSSHGWVGLLKKEKDRVRCGSSSGVSLWNPMSGSRVKLPPIHTYKCGRMEMKLMVNDGECSRAFFLGFSDVLGVCCPGECSEWTLFGRIRDWYADVVACSQNRVYSLSSENYELVRWNMKEPRRPRMEWKESLYYLGYDDELVERENKMFPPQFPGEMYDEYNHAYPHLVYAEHSDQLFVVRRHFVDQRYPNMRDYRMNWSCDDHPRTTKTVAFDVHLLVENENENERQLQLQLRHMEHSLDGLVMFVGLNTSFAVAAADFPHLKPDSIYFTDYDWDNGVYEGFDVGIYNYKNGTISSCYYPNYHKLLNRARRLPFWFTPTSAFKG